MCSHRPVCPSAYSADALAAHLMTAHPEQGWSLLCNGVLVFDDGGGLLPDGRTLEPPGRETAPRGLAGQQAAGGGSQVDLHRDRPAWPGLLDPHLVHPAPPGDGLVGSERAL